MDSPICGAARPTPLGIDLEIARKSFDASSNDSEMLFGSTSTAFCFKTRQNELNLGELVTLVAELDDFHDFSGN